MTVDMHAVRSRTFGSSPGASEPPGAGDGEWQYPFFWHLNTPEAISDEEEVVGTLFNAPEHIATARELLDAAAPEQGRRLREAMRAGGEDGEARWSGETLAALVEVLSQIPSIDELGGAVPSLDDEAVSRLGGRLDLARFHSPAPVTMEEKREALYLWVHNAGVLGCFLEKALENDCDVIYW